MSGDAEPGAQLRRPVIPREGVMVVVPTLAEGDERDEVAFDRQHEPVEGLGAEEVGHAVHGPGDVQDQHVPGEEVDDEGVVQGLVPQPDRRRDGQEHGEHEVQGLVIPETNLTLDGLPWGGLNGYFFWNMTRSSASRSDMSMSLPFSITAGCFLLINQPMWEKKKPLCALWGSASVSLYLWCSL